MRFSNKKYVEIELTNSKGEGNGIIGSGRGSSLRVASMRAIEHALAKTDRLKIIGTEIKVLIRNYPKGDR